ncbi:type II toxin-antitoxin system RelE/ParE family toxin [Mesorhizobium sp. M0047]|uniref:type II toxin-antitoxin system RelE/ParE family toxin n=1 Tax=Mesorhizobium sp. M0047 TaxID=2956859 RepID=UPI00333ADEF1
MSSIPERKPSWNGYDDIAERASPAIAWNFVVGIRDHCLGLSTFPQRDTERVEIMPGRAVSIAFAAEGERVLILGIFYAGRNITPELLEDRL